VESGSLTFQLIDEDGDELPGTWSYEWSGRDPFELAVFAVTELSGKPWKWSTQARGRGVLSPQRCRAFKVRVGRLFNKKRRPQTAAVLARIITQETMRPGQPGPNVKEIAAILTGKAEVDWDAGPAQTAPAMLRALRNALRAAFEGEGGLRISWG
jgi:hypothetical protein